MTKISDFFERWCDSIDSPRHRSLQIRKQAAQSKLHELRQRARYACFVPSDFQKKGHYLGSQVQNDVNFQKKGVFLGYHLCLRWERQNNRNFTLSRTPWVLTPLYKKRESLVSFSFSLPSGILRQGSATSSMTNPWVLTPLYKKRGSLSTSSSGCPVGFEPTTFRTTI